MSNVFYIAKRELNAYFSSVIAYIIIAVFMFIFGYFFLFYLNQFNMMSMQAGRMRGMEEMMNIIDMVFAPAYGNMGVIMLFIIPLITMRLFAEEKKSKTIELIMTSPVYITELVIGKFLAALMLLSFIFLLTAYSAFILFAIAQPDIGPVISTYIGMLLICGAFISIGIFSSTLTENQLVASVISFGLILFFWIIGWISEAAGGELGKLFAYLSLIEHLNNFLKGVIETSDVVYYLSFTIFWLFATHRVIESRRWK